MKLIVRNPNDIKDLMMTNILLNNDTNNDFLVNSLNCQLEKNNLRGNFKI